MTEKKNETKVIRCNKIFPKTLANLLYKIKRKKSFCNDAERKAHPLIFGILLTEHIAYSEGFQA